MKKIKIGFSNIKERAGHEGLNYYADVYVNKTKVGSIENDGVGGEYMTSVDESIKSLLKYIAINYLPKDKYSEYNDMETLFFRQSLLNVIKKNYKIICRKERAENVNYLITFYEDGTCDTVYNTEVISTPYQRKKVKDSLVIRTEQNNSKPKKIVESMFITSVFDLEDFLTFEIDVAEYTNWLNNQEAEKLAKQKKIQEEKEALEKSKKTYFVNLEIKATSPEEAKLILERLYDSKVISIEEKEHLKLRKEIIL